jgi:signal transduction protein with GAF and PtsI domain
MLRANEGLGNLHIMLPMVSTGQELDRVHSILATVACQLRAKGLASPLPPVGITLEVPSAISQLHFWKDKIDFVSIGSNDLSQYLLAVDRNNTRVSAYFNNTSPAVLFEIKRIVSICLELDIPVSICGEMASDPVAAILLIGMGMDSLSVNASRLPRIKSLIRQITYDRARELLDIVLTMDNADAIRQLVEQELHEHGLEQLIT